MNFKKMSTVAVLSVFISMGAISLSNAQEVKDTQLGNIEKERVATYGYTAPDSTKQISLNQSNVFTVDKNNSTEWVKFTVSQNGYITLDLERALFAGGEEGDIDIIIQDESGKFEYLNTESDDTKWKTSTTNTWKVGLKPGTYYMKLDANFTIGESYMNLNYKVGFTSNNNFETEGYWKAINLGTKYSGIMCENGSYAYDTDHYTFTVKENGHYTFNINHGLNKAYDFVLKDRYDRTVYSFYSSSMNNIDGRNYSYTFEDLTPGEYKLTIYDSYNPQDEYTFSISKAKNGWVKQGGYWYYYDKGEIVTDWHTVGEKEYFFDTTGKMKTGWFNDYGTWYYLGTSGAKHKGWLNIKGIWYYMDDTGSMQTGLQIIGDNTYYFNNNGSMFNKGWKMIDGDYYYFNHGGSARKGWYQEKGTWYYLDSYSGQMSTGKTTIGNSSYIFSDNGKMLKGWIEYDYDWYYANSNGVLRTGWFKDKGKWYYLHEIQHYTLTGGWYIDYEYNYFNENGVWQY